MVDTKKIIVVGDRVLIRPEEKNTKTTSGLYLPPGVKEKEKVQSGYIINVGPGYPIAGPNDDEPWKQNEGGKYIPLQAEVGDYALFLKRDAIEIEIDGEKRVIVPQSAILLLQRDEGLLNY